MTHDFKPGDQVIYTCNDEFGSPWMKGNTGVVTNTDLDHAMIQVRFDCEPYGGARIAYGWRFSHCGGPW